MASSSNLWGDRWGRAPHDAHIPDQVLSRRRARQMSRRFAGVGVGIPAARLREIAAGAPSASEELMDFNFALAATELKRQERMAKFKRSRRRAIHWLIVAGMVLAALNLLLCMTYGFVTLVLHESPW
jgi:hypothetical protein